MRGKSLPSERDLDPASIKRRTALFTKYILPHKGLIYSICIKYTNDEQYIEDNYSEVLVNFFRYMETYNPERQLKSWIYSVAQRYVFDLNRRNKPFPKDDNIDVGFIPDMADEGHVSHNCMGMDNYREFYNDDILAALDQLAPIHKEALLLQQAGYRMDEIVEIAYQNGSLKAKNADTIKSRIFLAKKNMRELLTREGGLKKEDEEYG